MQEVKVGGSQVGGLQSRGAQAKTTKAKRAGGQTGVMECLPSKHEALRSNPTGQKKKRKEKKQSMQFSYGYMKQFPECTAG
jgi:hypothetical protein